MDHPNYTQHGWSGYMMTDEDYALMSETTFTDPPNIGNIYVMPESAATDCDQRKAKAQWVYFKETHDSFKNTKTALKTMSERVINDSYHTSGNTVFMSTGFVALNPYEILQRFCTMYS